MAQLLSGVMQQCGILLYLWPSEVAQLIYNPSLHITISLQSPWFLTLLYAMCNKTFTPRCIKTAPLASQVTSLLPYSFSLLYELPEGNCTPTHQLLPPTPFSPHQSQMMRVPKDNQSPAFLPPPGQHSYTDKSSYGNSTQFLSSPFCSDKLLFCGPPCCTAA